MVVKNQVRGKEELLSLERLPFAKNKKTGQNEMVSVPLLGNPTNDWNSESKFH